MNVNEPTEDDKQLFLSMSDRMWILYEDKKQTNKTRCQKLRLQDDLDHYLKV